MPIVAFFVILAGAAIIYVLYPHLRVISAAVFLLFGALTGYMIADRWLGNDPTASALAPADLVLTDLELVDGSRFQTLSGRVENLDDTARLRSFDVSVRVLDCPTDDSADTECAIIAEDSGIARTDVPPGQVRDFEATLGFSNRTKPKGVVRWQHEVTGVRGTD